MTPATKALVIGSLTRCLTYAEEVWMAINREYKEGEILREYEAERDALIKAIAEVQALP